MQGSWKRRVLLLIIVCLSVSVFAQNAKIVGSRFPRFFNPEDEDRGFERAQPPSDTVLDALLATSEAKASASEIEGLSREKLRGLFRVVPVHLGRESEQDFLAQGQGPLTGADCDWFWIVRVKEGHAKVLLFSNGLAVTISKHSTNGYSDIRGDWATAAFTGMEIFRYDGHRYQLAVKRTKENRP